LQLDLECNYSRKASRTPLTRNNLTAAEDQVRDLETAIKALFPGVDIETVLSSTIRPSENASVKTNIAASPSSKLSPSSREASHEAEATSESLPQAADGFDWTENAVSLNELADGMAALSVNPEGAGYLGKSRKAMEDEVLTRAERGYFERRSSPSITQSRARRRSTSF
jgi:transcriptional regulatory protein GAL4